jgi:hypothetical protein
VVRGILSILALQRRVLDPLLLIMSSELQPELVLGWLHCAKIASVRMAATFLGKRSVEIAEMRLLTATVVPPTVNQSTAAGIAIQSHVGRAAV